MIKKNGSKFLARALLLVVASTLSACGAFRSPFVAGEREMPAHVLPDTQTSGIVRALPEPERQLSVAVYEFPDLTGQHKPNSNFAEYSRAVTQGADAILVDVLKKTGNGKWFNVVERRGLSNVLRERQLIQATRQQFQGPDAEPLDPMTFAGAVIEGGVVAYESNLRTGGIGARLLGVGANTEYQEDYVTVNLRLVSVTSSKVLLSVTTTKQIYSTLVQGNVFRYVSTDSLLEMDAGLTRNSPPQFALREAIELAVFAMVMEGNEKGLWRFVDPEKAAEAVTMYAKRSLDHGLGTASHVSRHDTRALEAVPMADAAAARFLDEETAELVQGEQHKTLDYQALRAAFQELSRHSASEHHRFLTFTSWDDLPVEAGSFLLWPTPLDPEFTDAEATRELGYGLQLGTPAVDPADELRL